MDKGPPDRGGQGPKARATKGFQKYVERFCPLSLSGWGGLFVSFPCAGGRTGGSRPVARVGRASPAVPPLSFSLSLSRFSGWRVLRSGRGRLAWFAGLSSLVVSAVAGGLRPVGSFGPRALCLVRRARCCRGVCCVGGRGLLRFLFRSSGLVRVPRRCRVPVGSRWH